MDYLEHTYIKASDFFLSSPDYWSKTDSYILLSTYSDQLVYSKTQT